MGSTWAKDHILETPFNNGVTLNFPRTTPQDSTANPVSSPATSSSNEAPRDDGNTLLHLAAAQYEHTSEDKSQLKMVERVYSQHPEMLEATNNLGRSPYLHRVIAYKLDFEKVQKDPIAFFLKDRIMHIHSHDTILDLLYGKAQVNHGPGEDKQSSMSRDRGQSREFDERELREINLDLREVQIRGISTDKKSLLNFLGKRKFEDILQYVQIPRRPFRPDTPQSGQNPTTDGTGTGTALPVIGVGRNDFQDIFKLLQTRGVKKIVQLIVDDEEEYPHRDDVIEAVAEFGVEVFEWRKMDLSSTVIKAAAANATQLRLFSSGNECVLRDWSSCDGLKQLGSVSQLKFYEDL
jgi:hypothetical protein